MRLPRQSPWQHWRGGGEKGAVQPPRARRASPDLAPAPGWSSSHTRSALQPPQRPRPTALLPGQRPGVRKATALFPRAFPALGARSLRAGGDLRTHQAGPGPMGHLEEGGDGAWRPGGDPKQPGRRFNLPALPAHWRGICFLLRG